MNFEFSVTALVVTSHVSYPHIGITFLKTALLFVSAPTSPLPEVAAIVLQDWQGWWRLGLGPSSGASSWDWLAAETGCGQLRQRGTGKHDDVRCG